MRVLHLNQAFAAGGGTETYLRRLAQLQRDQGDEVAVWVAENAWAAEADHGIRVAAVGPRNKLRWGQIGLGDLESQIRALRPEVIHLHNVLRLLNPWALDRLRRLFPLVWTIHDLELIAPLRQPMPIGYGWKLRRWQRRARRVTLLVPSQFLRRRVEAIGAAAQVLPHFGTPLYLGPPSQPSTILYLGGSRIEKGFQELLAALGMLQEWGLDFRAALVGSQVEPAIPAYMRALLGDRIECTERVSESELVALLGRAAIVVFPSLLPESFGYAGFEGCCAGRPVVAYDSGAIREWLLHDETGYLVPAGDQRALAKALARCLADPSRARALGEAGRRRVAESYRPEDHLERLRQIYREAARA